MYAIVREDCKNTVRESAQRADSGRKIPCHTGQSNLSQSRASPTLYQLSYIPALKSYHPHMNLVGVKYPEVTVGRFSKWLLYPSGKESIAANIA